MGIPLERPGVRVKAVRTVQFGNLADMSEVMVGKFVEHLRKCNDAHRRMIPGACAGGRRNRMEKEHKGSAQSHQFFEVLTRWLPRYVRLRRRYILRECRRFLDHHAAGALLVQ